MEIGIKSNAFAVAAQLASFGPILATELYLAMDVSLNLLEASTISYMFASFYNPSGELEGNFTQEITQDLGGIQGKLINDSPSAWRREAGFSGMTDSLGRFFPNDPGIDYMADTLANEADVIVSTFKDACIIALSYL